MLKTKNASKERDLTYNHYNNFVILGGSFLVHSLCTSSRYRVNFSLVYRYLSELHMLLSYLIEYIFEITILKNCKNQVYFQPLPQKLKHLLGSLDYLTSSIPATREAVRTSIQSLESRCDSFVSRLNVKRRNLSMAAHFFVLAQEVSFQQFFHLMLKYS